MGGENELALYALAIGALLLLAWSGLSMLSANAQQAGTLQNTPENYARFVASELPDKCKTPPGYTDEQWRQHWGHHPDQYKDCLASA